MMASILDSANRQDKVVPHTPASVVPKRHEPEGVQEMIVPASEWLNWPPAFQFIKDTGQERIDTTPVLSDQGSGDNQASDHSGIDLNESVTAAPLDLVIDRGREVGSRPECLAPSRSSRSGDPTVVEALQDVAGLLAVAYQRYKKIQLMPVNPPADSVNRDLAIGGERSVHGGGQLS